MKRFQDLPIKQKLLQLNLAICGAVLLVATAVTFVFQVLNFRASFQRDVATLAAVIANNSTAALAFNDAKGAAEVINSLKAKPTVVCACLTTSSGQVIAHFGETEDAKELQLFPPARQFRYTDGHLLYTEPVELSAKQVGTLFLRVDYRSTFKDLISFYGLLIVGITVVSTLLAAFLSGKLGRVITRPVLQLAETAQNIGEQKDYSLRAPVSQQRDELGRLTSAFNQMLNRIQEQDESLTLSQHKIEALINSIEGIVWECTPDTFQFTFVSRQCERILGYPPEQWMADASFWHKHLHPEDAANAIQLCHGYASAGRPYSYEYRMIAADGRVVWIRESGSVMFEHDQAVAMRGIFLDITAQKNADMELNRLNRRLLETSRLAGMAEVATGVLHNVGNVLNSVSVSATLVSDRLKQSKVSNLCRATNLLGEQDGNLAQFLTSDPKGKVLPAYLRTVAGQLTAERTEMLGEVTQLAQNIEHIKEIVAMQQSYAKVSGAFENLEPIELVEDAIRMNAAAFDRHRIEVSREYAENLPRVHVDRHKVLQILTNVLRNAKYALDAGKPADKRVTVRVFATAAGPVSIQVRDNGVGIAPENLARIFQHGFTTKKDGHGFGLHSGANAAKEMGGSLRAHSHGLGKGADFTLELPVNPQQPAIAA